MGAAGETTPPATSKATTKTTTAPAETSPPAATTPPAPDQEAQQQQQHQPQLQPAATAPGYNEWAAAFQAYYQANAGQAPAGAFPHHPYMWAGQPMMPPYGGPHPTYGGMFPPGTMYAHPMYAQYGAPQGEAVVAQGEQADLKPETKPAPESLKQTPLKRSKGSRGSLQLMKVSESGGKRNGVSHSSNGDDNETGSDGGSTEGSRDENEQNLLPKRRFELMALDNPAGGQGGIVAPPGGSGAGMPTVGAPTTGGGSLEMSLDYWGTGPVPPAKLGKQLSGSPSTNTTPNELWLQDERELKRQRRKQANRESARRSRLRKQAECEELETRVDTLTVENVALRTELTRVTEECKRLQGEVSSLLQQLRSNPPSENVAPAQSPAPVVVEPPPSENEAPAQFPAPVIMEPPPSEKKDCGGEIERKENLTSGNGVVKPKDENSSEPKSGEEQAAAA